MKYAFFFISVLFLTSCISEETPDHMEIIRNTPGMHYVKDDIQKEMEKRGLKGSVLVYEMKHQAFYSNDYDWAKKGQLPASTFKIPNSIIALETEVVDDDSTLFEWDGEQRMMDSWEKDMILREAFHASCVPCYQLIARDIGVNRMKEFVKKLDYGSMDVNEDNIDLFWLQGKSKINQYQQIHFLRQLYDSKLPISIRTEKIIKRMIVRKETDDYTLRGKTGFSIQDEIWNGWFVGYVETKDNVFFFATNVSPKDQEGGMTIEEFTKSRLELTNLLLEDLGVPMNN